MNDGLHPRFLATMQNIGNGTPNQQQHIILTGTIAILRQRVCANGGFAGEQGEEARSLTKTVANELARLDITDQAAWDDLKEPLRAAMVALHTM